MFKLRGSIKDRVLLGITAGLLGNLAKTLVDEFSLRMKISQRSFRETVSGVWVSTHKEAISLKGQLLGVILDFGMGALGGIATTNFLTKYGRDKVVFKGLISGMTLGSFITFALSAFPKNNVRPKDAASNLSYIASHAVSGLVTAGAVSFLGNPSVFDAKPLNDYLPPTLETSEQESQRLATYKREQRLGRPRPGVRVIRKEAELQ